MKEFIKTYVNSMLEMNNLKLSDSKIDNIVNSLQDDDELWDYVDSIVSETIAREIGEEE